MTLYDRIAEFPLKIESYRLETVDRDQLGGRPGTTAQLVSIDGLETVALDFEREPGNSIVECHNGFLRRSSALFVFDSNSIRVAVVDGIAGVWAGLLIIHRSGGCSVR